MKKQLVDILWTDECILVINKPAGLLAMQDRFKSEISHLATVLEPDYGKIWIVHRLDQDTSGVMVVARSLDANRVLTDQFVEGRIGKSYRAIIIGRPEWNETTIDFPLMIDGDRRHRTIVNKKHGKIAVTDVRVLERFSGLTLVEAVPRTGRTHQIRVHLAALGFPIAADPLYGDGNPVFLSSFKRDFRGSRREERPLIDRTALHALTLSLDHPLTNNRHSFEAPFPKDFSATLRQLTLSREI